MSNRETVRTTASEPNLRMGGILQRTCASCGQHTVAGGGCSECDMKKSLLQRNPSNSKVTNGVPPMVHEVLRSPGQPLDAATRAFMEPRFGHDFSGVRVHTDSRAVQSAQAVNALAYTMGRDIVFGDGLYRPRTSEGNKLLAHELAHVVQQNSSKVDNVQTAKISEPSDALEQEADHAAQSVLAGTPASVSPAAAGLVQRLGANPGCTPAQANLIHQAIFNARGWINKAIPALEGSPLSATALASLRRNFGPTYGVAANASLIHDRLVAARRAMGANSYSCATAPADAICAAGSCGWSGVGSHASTICSNNTLGAGNTWQFQAGCMLHEAFHATFSGMTATHDFYSGWHGQSGSTAGYPGAGIDPLLNADSYTTLVMELS